MAAHQAFFNGFGDHLARFFHQTFGFTDVDESTGYDIRSGKELVGAFLQCQDYDQDSVFCKMLTVTQYDIAHVSDTKSIYQDLSGVYLIYHFCTFIIQCKDIS